MSDERCGPWVYASARRRWRECRGWEMTDEHLADRRSARPVTDSLAMQLAECAECPPAGTTLSIWDFHNALSDMDEARRYYEWVRERAFTLGPDAFWSEMSARWELGPAHPERSPITDADDARARRLVESALEGTQ